MQISVPKCICEQISHHKCTCICVGLGSFQYTCNVYRNMILTKSVNYRYFWDSDNQKKEINQHDNIQSVFAAMTCTESAYQLDAGNDNILQRQHYVISLIKVYVTLLYLNLLESLFHQHARQINFTERFLL